MGHYRSEMEEPTADPYNYKRVFELGFKSVNVDYASVMQCPECLCLVEGKYAERHMDLMHRVVWTMMCPDG